MIRVEQLVFNSFGVNTYLVYDAANNCLVVDPAFYTPDEQKYFELQLADRGLQLKGLINTHCHIDHVLGIDYIREKYQLPLQAHELETDNLEKAPLMGDLFGWQLAPLQGIEKKIGHGDKILLGNDELLALHVPGHSTGSLAFYSAKGGFVITGDVLFRESIGRSDLPGGDYDTLMSSIKSELMVLPGETTVYPGHGESSTIAHEAASNPFINLIE